MILFLLIYYLSCFLFNNCSDFSDNHCYNLSQINNFDNYSYIGNINDDFLTKNISSNSNLIQSGQKEDSLIGPLDSVEKAKSIIEIKRISELIKKIGKDEYVFFRNLIINTIKIFGYNTTANELDKMEYSFIPKLNLNKKTISQYSKEKSIYQFIDIDSISEKIQGEAIFRRDGNLYCTLDYFFCRDDYNISVFLNDTVNLVDIYINLDGEFDSSHIKAKEGLIDKINNDFNKVGFYLNGFGGFGYPLGCIHVGYLFIENESIIDGNCLRTYKNFQKYNIKRNPVSQQLCFPTCEFECVVRRCYTIEELIKLSKE
jgi:hypothetical protein